MKTILLSAAIFIGLASSASASPIYSCPAGSSQCEGQTFALWLEASGSGYYDIAASIDTGGYKGLADGTLADYAFGVEIKSLVSGNPDYTGVSLISAPGGISLWDASIKQLSQDCVGNDFGDTACAVWDATGVGYQFAVGDVLTWVFHISTGATLDDGIGHIKYRYLDASGQVVAGLLSQDIALQDCRGDLCDNPNTPDDVLVTPEPASLVLLGTGLAFVVVRRRRRTS